jgi:ABC-type multidrug transport system ATPase subunit
MAAHIDNTLRALGLQDIADNKIGTPISRGISGGQKRRVTIGCSLVARPRVLVLDEPTSGLDAASGREVIAASEYRRLLQFTSSLIRTSAVKRLAVETNTICIATIHQPNYETFALFDSLLLLAGGRVMYNGPTGTSTSLSDLTVTHQRPR